jgi:hypothetical protein
MRARQRMISLLHLQEMPLKRAAAKNRYAAA